MTKDVHGTEINGVSVDSETRCAHYNSEIDIIAIKFKCCENWFPCFECHAETADHAPQVWSVSERAALAVLCGGCGHRLSIAEYLDCDSTCPKCLCRFNPGCARHYHLYFETSRADIPSRF